MLHCTAEVKGLVELPPGLILWTLQRNATEHEGLCLVEQRGLLRLLDIGVIGGRVHHNRYLGLTVEGAREVLGRVVVHGRVVEQGVTFTDLDAVEAGREVGLLVAGGLLVLVAAILAFLRRLLLLGSA